MSVFDFIFRSVIGKYIVEDLETGEVIAGPLTHNDVIPECLWNYRVVYALATIEKFDGTYEPLLKLAVKEITA